VVLFLIFTICGEVPHPSHQKKEKYINTFTNNFLVAHPKITKHVY